MTLSITKEEKCSYIRLFDSEELTAYYNAPSSSINVELGVKYNCGTEKVFELTDSDLALDADTSVAYIEIDSAFLNEDPSDDSVLKDGVFTIRLKITQADGSIEQDTICVGTVCEAKCKVMEYLASNLNSNLHHHIYALDNLHLCDECQCEAGCVIYTDLQNKLKNDVSNSCSDC